MSDSANITQHYQLATVYGANFVEHPTGSGSTRRWLDSREIGRGGFGVVKAQNAVHSTAVRAVKIITKRDIPAGLDWKREIVAMATLAKVGFALAGAVGRDGARADEHGEWSGVVVFAVCGVSRMV